MQICWSTCFSADGLDAALGLGALGVLGHFKSLVYGSEDRNYLAAPDKPYWGFELRGHIVTEVYVQPFQVLGLTDGCGRKV